MNELGLGLLIVLLLVLLTAILIHLKRQPLSVVREQLPKDPFQSEANLRRIFESIQDYAIFSYSRDHTITSWNPGVQRVLGFDKDEFVGKKLDMIFDEVELQQGVPEQEIERAISEGSSATEGIRVRKNGRKFWGSGMVRPLVSELGEIGGFIKVLQDLTVRRQLEESLQEAKDSAEEANNAKDEFIAVLSHELRSPLTPISAALDVLESKEQDENGNVFIDMIRRNLALELRLIDDLLDVTRIARGKLAVKPEVFDAHGKITETIDIFHSEIQQKNLQLEHNLGASEHFLLADPARYQQIIWNLIRNAVKFTPENGFIFVDTMNENGSLVMTVRDTGIGMEPEALLRIFRPFVQGMPNIARKYGGLGLGLTIARALTQTFSGNLSATSPGEGLGTTFRLELPTVESEEMNLAGQSGMSNGRVRRKGRLLLIDDQADARIALSALLKQKGYEVDSTDGLRQAVDLVKKSSYDLILSDIQLNGESGWDLLPKLPRPIPAIAISALGTPANVETSLRAGFLAHVIKPFRVVELDAQIQEILSFRKVLPSLPINGTTEST